jgi:Tfp pilus tip-associated adhesin PilY1
MYGDLKASASTPEKTVGFSWSDPAVGPLDVDRTVNAVMVGSGYFPNIEDALPGRGPGGPRAGRSFYLLKIEDGTLIGSPLTCGTANGSRGCLDVGASVGSAMKNALQADPSAAGNSGSPVVNKAYIGDLSGKYWKFAIASDGSLSKNQMVDTGQPIFSSSALLFVGTTNVYMFFSTGSDLLPTTSPQGTGRFKLWALQDNAPGAGATTKFTRDLAIVSDSGGAANGERPSTAPSVAGDIVFFTTTTENGTAPCTNMTANLYGFTYLGGAAYDSASSGNNRLDTNESPLIRSVAGRATAPFIVDQHLYFVSSGGTTGAPGDPNAPGSPGLTLEMFGDPEDFNNGVGQVGIRILSWREIR